MSDKKPVVFMIEDDPGMLFLNRTNLARHGIETISAESLSKAREMLSKPFDLILLDILLPDGNGLDFVPEIRAVTDVPILMLTSKREEADIVKGLLGGGDDYMTKPFRNEELCARIAALIRRAEMVKTHGREVTKGLLKLDTLTGRAYLSGEDLLLTQKEFALLLMLAQNEGKLLPKEHLYETIWNQPMAGDDRAMRKHLSNVRSKLAGSGYSISVSRGEGYCFEPTLE
ncbi:MAG: response regulator transcription factor [Clostridiales bacterium]|nr:response regulator transcription factor [Clostridiales bacterium]